MFTKEMSIENINNYLPQKFSFICFVSFEKRCLNIPLQIQFPEDSYVYLIRNIDEDILDYNEKNFFAMKDYCSRSKEVTISIQKSLSISQGIFNILNEIIQNDIDSIIVDISTFTREALLILINQIYAYKDKFCNVIFLYNIVEKYFNEDLPSKMWLSKGCKDVRNVIGYAGKIIPDKELYLVLLTGYEIERATRLIDILEPDRLVMGNSNEPINEIHDKAMCYINKKFLDWEKNLLFIPNETFDFSCKDLCKTVNILKKITKSQKNSYIIAPLNSKISTIAVSIVALLNRNIQVCYSIPEIYNLKGNSTLSNHLIFIDVLKMFEKCMGIFK